MVLEEGVLAKVPQEGLAAVVRAEPGRWGGRGWGAGLGLEMVGRLTPRLEAGLLGWNLVEAGVLELSEGGFG